MTIAALDALAVVLDRALSKYSEDQPRDEQGRWSEGGGEGGGREVGSALHKKLGGPELRGKKSSFPRRVRRAPSIPRVTLAAGEEPLLTRLASRMEPAMRRAFVAAVRGAADAIDLGALAEAVASGAWDQIELAALFGQLPRRMLERLLPVIGRTFVLGIGAGAEAAHLGARAVLAYGFDVKNPESIAWAREHAAKLVTEVTDSTKSGLRALVTASQAEGISPADLALEIREVVGLHSLQVGAVGSFRSRLAGRGVGGDELDDRVAKYADAQLQRRAVTIARTETIDASCAGQDALWTAAREAGDIEDARRVWIVTWDDRLCEEICEPLDGVEADIGEPFVHPETGEEYDRPAAHVQCRCSFGLVFGGEDGRRRRTWSGIGKYSEDQPRDDAGRWTEGGGGGLSPADAERQGRLDAWQRDGLKSVAELAESLRRDGIPIAPPGKWEELGEDEQSRVAEAWIEESLDRFRKNAKDEWREDMRYDLGKDRTLVQNLTRETLEGMGVDAASANELASGVARLTDSLNWDAVDVNIDEERFWDLRGEAFERELEKQTEDVPDEVYIAARASAYREWDAMTSDGQFEAWQGFFGEHSEKSTVRSPSVWRLFRNGRAYRETKTVIRELQARRASEIAVERETAGGLAGDAPKSADVMRVLGREVWAAWKGDSQSPLGQAFQMAVVDELGAHSRLTDDQRRRAFGAADELPGGYSNLRAYVRATWETTQYALAQADIQEVTLYRALMLPDKDLKGVPQEVEGDVYTYHSMRTLRLLQNGAASFTAKRNIANSWEGIGNLPETPHRVIIRAAVPVTAIVSIPAYGDNYAEEEEVVVAGTPWRRWDAWHNEAPTEREVPMRRHVKAKASERDLPDDTPGLLTQEGGRDAAGLILDLAALDVATGAHWLSGGTGEKGKGVRRV